MSRSPEGFQGPVNVNGQKPQAAAVWRSGPRGHYFQSPPSETPDIPVSSHPKADSEADGDCRDSQCGPRRLPVQLLGWGQMDLTDHDLKSLQVLRTHLAQLGSRVRWIWVQILSLPLNGLTPEECSYLTLLNLG